MASPFATARRAAAVSSSHGYAHNLQIANNRVHNNTGTMSGGITIGVGEHPDVELAGAAAVLSYPESCENSNVTNLALPFCFNLRVNIHNNAVVGNSSMGDELFSSTPAGAGGVSINSGADYYKFTNNWVCGNISNRWTVAASPTSASIKNGDNREQHRHLQTRAPIRPSRPMVAASW